jgi:hypothetical protein
MKLMDVINLKRIQIMMISCCLYSQHQYFSLYLLDESIVSRTTHHSPLVSNIHVSPVPSPVICCCLSHPVATELWATLLQELRLWMLQSKGKPSLVAAICSSLSSWRNNIPYTVIINLY